MRQGLRLVIGDMTLWAIDSAIRFLIEPGVYEAVRSEIDPSILAVKREIDSTVCSAVGMVVASVVLDHE
jgi:hypothetical protein